MLWDLAAAVYGVGILFLLVEQFAKRLSQQVIDFPVAEEHIIGGEQFFLIFQLLVVLLDLFIADYLSQHGHIHGVHCFRQR